MDDSKLEQGNQKTLVMLQRRNERLKSDNMILAKELSESVNLTKRLASSLGINNIPDARAAVDAVDCEPPYMKYLENIQCLTGELSAKMEEVEEMREDLETTRRENVVLRLKLKECTCSPSRPNFPLDGDTTDYLLTLLPNVSDLRSFVLASKFIYRVFQARNDSIVHAVVSNQVGDVLPQALRLSRCENDSLRQQDVKELPKEDTVSLQPINRNEAETLVRNYKVVRALENHFSWRHKDRKSRTSVLTPKESKRFKSAMYRVMLLSFIYGMNSFPGHMFEEIAPSEMLMLSQSKQRAFLNSFVSDDLNQIQTVSYFLHRTVNWAFSAASDGDILSMINIYDLNGLYLSAGPTFILGCYSQRSSRLSEGPRCHIDKTGENGPYLGFIVSATDDILKERGTRIRNLPRIILEPIQNQGETDKCTHCASMFEWRRGVHLWNETNWDYLKGQVGYDLHHQFKGKLWSNRAEKGFRAALRNIEYPVLMNELFEMRPDSYKEWTKQQWICFDCLRQFITDILPFWWLSVKRKANLPIMKDCRYGYDCSDQINPGHADLYNHLCAPVQVARGLVRRVAPA